MAQYKYPQFLLTLSSPVFDALHEPGQSAPYAGIYRCEGCGHEIGIAFEHTLPPQNHHQHSTAQGKIRWRLIVYAQHNA